MCAGSAWRTGTKTTISALADTDRVVLKMGRRTVFELRYDGGHAARDALLKCMAGGPAAR